MTTDGTQHYQALSALEGEGIPFQEKTQAMGHNTRRAGTVGAVGERPGASVLYYPLREEVRPGKGPSRPGDGGSL